MDMEFILRLEGDKLQTDLRQADYILWSSIWETAILKNNKSADIRTS